MTISKTEFEKILHDSAVSARDTYTKCVAMGAGAGADIQALVCSFTKESIRDRELTPEMQKIVDGMEYQMWCKKKMMYG